MSDSNDTMTVINRHGEAEEISLDIINNRIKKLAKYENSDYKIEALSGVNTIRITQETVSKLFNHIITRQLDTESARVCASLEIENYSYGLLGGRILADDHHKHLDTIGLNTFTKRTNYLNAKLPNFYNSSYVEFINANSEQLDSMIFIKRDFLINYFGYKTLQKSYLIKNKDEIIETPQDMFLRVAIAIHFRSNLELEDKLAKIKLTYDTTSSGYFTHATPTLFNAGTAFEQMSSCYLLGTDDSLSGIFKTVADTAQISKWAGGIGIHVSNIRSNGSDIKSTNGKSDGIIPMLKVYNEVARYVNQGGKRKGSIAIYLEPWHADIEAFLDLKKNTGAETERTRDLFTALWIPDEFMRRVEADEDWFLMCPSKSPGLNEVYDESTYDPDKMSFTKLYNKYIESKSYVKVIKAKELFMKIMESQIESGVPYILFKDNINRKSNQSNIGIVKSSNLCSEIIEVSDSEEYAVCNLGSIALNKFIKTDELKKYSELELINKWKTYSNENTLTSESKTELMDFIKSIYDFDKLINISRCLTYNLNNLIDYNYYPVPETRKSNLKNRPIGIGVQGLGDLYYMLNLPYSSYVAKLVDSMAMESIYYGAISESTDIARQRNHYQTYYLNGGSPFSHGKFQFDLWQSEAKFDCSKYPQMYDWSDLKELVRKQGMANSLLTSLMPTATTSQILGNNECFEPYSSNIYKRTTLAGEFQVVNKHLINKFKAMNMWNEDLRNGIIKSDGSIQNIVFNNLGSEQQQIINHMKDVFKTVWEVKQKDIIDHSLARGPYVDQSQSMNMFFANPNFQSLYSAILYGWKNGIKTGCYYLRSKPATEAIQYAIEPCISCSA